MKRKISLVGAGLVGSLWAVLLQKRGYEVSVFEKRSDLRKETNSDERSINLVITSRGLRGLEQAGLLQEALKLSVPIFGRMIHAKNGHTAFQAYGKQDECNFSISRSELNKFLIQAAENAGAKIFFERSLEDINFESKVLSFSHGDRRISHNYDLLFGTDGAGSRVRKKLCELMPLEFQERTDWLEADYKELFLPAGENNQYKIEKNALHIWPRGSHMMMALANLDGSFTMTLYMPKNGQRLNFSMIDSEQKVEEFFQGEFKDAIPLMPYYVDDFINKPQSKLGTVHCSKWLYKDSVALMGDAAHAIVPFFGQGMNSGFEDCTTFLKVLDEARGDWSKALINFEKIQKPNAEAIATMAIENWVEMRDKVGDAQFLLRKKVEGLLEKKFPTLYKSRYGMVTYTQISYALAQQAGRIQDQILGELCQGIESSDELSLDLAEKLLRGDLARFISTHQLELRTDPLVSNCCNVFKTK